MLSQPNSPNSQQVYRVAMKVLDSSKLKYGGFNYQPVIFRIPSGYARTGAYLKLYANNDNNYNCGLCDFDTLEDRVETNYSGWMTPNFFVAVYDTGEFIVTTGNIVFLGAELLDPSSLNPIGFMVWTYNPGTTNSAVFATQNSVTSGSISYANPEYIRVGNAVYVSRLYFITPLGITVTRYLYSSNTQTTVYKLPVQIGSRKFIPVGTYLIDITDEV
jgi:hypothetical protein